MFKSAHRNYKFLRNDCFLQEWIRCGHELFVISLRLLDATGQVVFASEINHILTHEPRYGIKKWSSFALASFNPKNKNSLFQPGVGVFFKPGETVIRGLDQ